MSQFMPSLSKQIHIANRARVIRTLTRAAFATAMILLMDPAAVRADDGSKPSEQSGPAIMNPLAKQSLQSLTATLQRPLFAPSRKPPPPEPPPVVRAEEPPPPPQQPTVVLVGTMIDAQGPQAILRSGSDNKDLRVRVGDDLSGWKITDIDEGHLTLALNDRTFSVALFPENTNPVQNVGTGQSPHSKRAALHERER